MSAAPNALTRMVDGRLAPAPGRWTFEAGNSEIAFVVKHMMISKVRGAFREFSGELTITERPLESQASVTIKADSIDTGLAFRDRDLRSGDFLDVERQPTLEFVSTAVAVDGDDWALTGDLTIAGQTRPITLAVAFQGAAVDPWGHAKAVFSGRTEFRREDWGLTYNKAIEGGGVLIGSTVKVEIEIQAKPAPDGSAAVGSAAKEESTWSS
jgi:polyisoprenoid-binding protein YceI